MTDKILFVDDDPNALEGFKRQLRKQFTIETATSGEEGLTVLRAKGPFAVVVSDMRMPVMNGARFLGQVHATMPDTVRLLLTGQANLDDAISAINDGHIFRFLVKPCPLETLHQALLAALEQHRLITAERTLLEQTVQGCIKMLTDVLALVSPVAFGRAARLKQYMHHLVSYLDLPDTWQYEIAAMLSQIGCVALPSDLLQKLDAGRSLTSEERQLVHKHPDVAYDLLRRIPRLEAVAGMVARQHDPDADREALQGTPYLETVLLGAHMLKTVLSFDQLLMQGMSHEDAIARLRKEPDPYGIVMALASIELQEAEKVPRLVRVRELMPGMVLDEDVRTTSGLLVLAKGYEVTPAMIERFQTYARRVPISEPFRVWVPNHLC